MLAVQKKDQDRIDSEALTASGFGKVLSSIHGLQQRLGDFSYGEVSIAEAKVKLLIKQLGTVADSLASVAQLKQAVSQTSQHISNLPEENFDRVEMDSLENHPQLHAIIKASKLIRVQSRISPARTEVESVAVDTAIRAPRRATQAREKPVDNAHLAPAWPKENIQTDPATDRTQSIPLQLGPHDPSRGSSSMTFDEQDEASSTEPHPLPSRTPSKQTFPAKIDPPLNRTHEWTFDASEAPGLSEESTASFDFAFPAETARPRETPRPKPSTRNLHPTELPDQAETGAAFRERRSQSADTASALAEPRDLKKASANKSLAKSEESKALVPANSNLDHRLLDDVIKSYGDFAASANLPATIQSPPDAKSATGEGAATTARSFDEPLVKPRDFTDKKKAGDLDRQLKKIIKDYGEYDIYQRQSVVNLKTGGIAAFAVLGLVLGGLYLFGGAPSSARPPSPSRVEEPHQAARPIAAVPSKPAKASSPDSERPASPNPPNDPIDPATVTKQNP